VSSPTPDYYATLGLDRRCTFDQIRAAYRLLAKQYHPDLNGGSDASVAFTQGLNAAYSVLEDPERRKSYDAECDSVENKARSTQTVRPGKKEKNLAQDVLLRPDEFLRGARLEVRVKDPANPEGSEIYPLVMPPETAPGSRFKVPRSGIFEGGYVTVRVKPSPDPRFKVRGFDLRCDFKVSLERATQGGTEMIRGLSGHLRMQIPAHIGRGTVLRIPGEGLPRPRGGRGDLLVRITYRPAIHITRSLGR
jgi:curved DNA-binding protein